VLDKIVRIGNKAAVVLPKIVAGHGSVLLSALHKSLEVIVRETTITVKVGVTGADILLEVIESHGWLTILCETCNGTPGITVGATIAESPLDSIIGGETGALG